MQLSSVDYTAIDEALTGSSISDNRGQRLIQFMRQRTGHFSHQCDPTEMSEFLSMTLCLKCTLSSLRDIKGSPHHFKRLSSCSVDSPSSSSYPACCPIRSNNSVD